MYAVASGTKMLAAEPLSCIWSLQQTSFFSTDARLDRDLMKLVNTFNWLCSSIIPELFLLCGRAHANLSSRTSLPSSHNAAWCHALTSSMCASLSTWYNMLFACWISTKASRCHRWPFCEFTTVPFLTHVLIDADHCKPAPDWSFGEAPTRSIKHHPGQIRLSPYFYSILLLFLSFPVSNSGQNIDFCIIFHRCHDKNLHLGVI